MSHSQFHCKTLTLRHAWLSLWDKHMTTGRINQITYVSELSEESLLFSQAVSARRHRRLASAFSLAPNWITPTTGRSGYPELPQTNAFLTRAMTERTKARTLRHPHNWRTSNITHSFLYNNPFRPSLDSRFADSLIALLLSVIKTLGAARSAAIAKKALNFYSLLAAMIAHSSLLYIEKHPLPREFQNINFSKFSLIFTKSKKTQKIFCLHFSWKSSIFLLIPYLPSWLGLDFWYARTEEIW